MPYDPEDLGAQCYLCVLKEKRVGGPVPPEIHGGETVAVINDVPSQRDCDEQRPLTDGGGMEFTQTLVNIGQHRKKTAIFNAVCCRPPENDFDKLMLQWQRSNKKLVAKGEDALPSPIECCRPRLMKEVQGYNNFITLGKVAYKSLTESSSAILEIRGGPIEGRIDGDQFIFKPAPTGGVQAPGNWPVKLMPTIHPGMVTRVRKWTHAFRTDMARAFRFFKDQLNWVEPWMKFTPTPAELKAFIYSADQFAYDTETTVEDATVARLKCITLSTGEGGVCVPFYSIETNRSVYKDSDLEEIKQILREWFVDPRILKTGWNSGGFDVHIIENHLGVTPSPMLDGILLHRLIESELPHRLGYVGSVYTDVTAWKAAHTAKEARSDMELWTYGITDTIVTHRVIEVLAPIVQEKEQDHLVQKDHKIQELCAGMKHVGMWVDKDQRLKEAIRVQAEIIKYKQAAIRASGRPDLNLNSTYKLRDLLFGDWDLAPSEYTKSGDPSTGDDALRLIRTQNLSNTQVTTFIDALRMFRRASKEYGTYIARMIPYGQELKDVNLEWFDEDELGDDPEVARGLIMPDGRIHPNYLAHGTTSGRLSSSNPNSQNFPKHLRAMIKASPGHILVGADADQLELRIIASIAQIPIYLEAFAKGDDPHSHTAAMMFGEHFTKLEKKSTQWKNLRTLAKGIKYASFYGSGDETVHGIVTSGENEKGELLFPDLTLKQLRTIRRKWLGAIPQLPQWWDACLDYYRAYGYMKDPVWGRKRFFLNGEKFNEIVNFGPQSSGAHIIHEATFRILDAVPFFKWGKGTGLINQCHDALVFEVPYDHDKYEGDDQQFGWCKKGCNCTASVVANIIKSEMNVSVPGLPGVSFAAKPDIGMRWSEV